MLPETPRVNPIDHLRKRWKVPAVACALAVILSAMVTLLLPRTYTATARVLIEPPAGTDVRASMAVSPIYLESLRTYEHFAASDSLFQQALDEFNLRAKDPGRTIESWKRAVLDVGIPRNTKILEVSVTLTEPELAQRMAQYLAEKTVEQSRQVTREGDVAILGDVEKLLAQSRTEWEHAEEEWTKFLNGGPVAQLEDEIEALAERQDRLRRSLDEELVRTADYRTREAEYAQRSEEEREPLRLARQGAESRAAELRGQLQGVEDEWSQKRTQIAKRSASEDQLQARREQSRAAYLQLEERLHDLRSSIGFRGERLSVIDPGIVPEQPSSPNLPLNVIGAFLFALAVSIGYLLFEFAMLSNDSRPRPAVVAMRAKAHND